MRRFCFGMALLLIASAARAEEAADQPFLVLQSGGHTAPITKVLFAADGKEVVTVSLDKTVRRWDAVTGERLGVYYLPAGPTDQGELYAGALSPDGKTLAVASSGYLVDGKRVRHIFLLDMADGHVTATLPGGGLLAFSHDGKVLAAGGGHQAQFLAVASGKVLRTLKGHGLEKGGISDLAFSPDDKLLAVAAQGADASIWSVETGEEVCPALPHKAEAFSVAWKNDDTLATGGTSEIILWDRHGKLLRHFDTPHHDKAWIKAVAFVPGKEELCYSFDEEEPPAGEYMVSGGAVLNLAKPEASRDGFSDKHHNFPTYSAVSPDGRLAAVSDGLAVSLWAVKDGKLVRRLAGRGQTPNRAGWGPDGRVVGWSNGDADVLQRAFDLGELRFAKKPDTKFARAVHTQKHPKFGELRVDMPDNTAVKVISDNSKYGVLASMTTPFMHGADSYTFLPGARLALGTGDTVTLYDAPTLKPIHRLVGPLCRSWDLAPSPDGRYLLGAFTDQTLRVWDPDKPEPLLTLFVAGGDWVAWTQEGYYAASPGGEKLMGWQINNGLDALGAFHPAAEFHKAFYRPDIIKRVLAEGSVEKAREAADKASGKTTEAVDVAQALPPEATLLAPADGSKLDKADVEVKASAQSKGRPVFSLRLLLDGRPFPGAEVKKFPDAKPGDKQEAAWKATMPEGNHRLSVLAESDLSSAASRNVEVTYQPQPQEALPNLYVLAVGINEYPGSLKLEWAVKDAASIEQAFQAAAAPKPFGKIESTVLLDGKATKQGILDGLDWLKTKMTADDTAVVFYAGHGHRDRKTGQFYLLPSDVDVGDLEKTGVTGTQLKDKLRVVPGRVLMLLDACHSGAIGQSPADPGSLTDDVQRQLAAPDCGVVVMCAAMAQEEAGESPAVQDGFFTKALLMGLAGAAPRSKDGLIHLTALNFYVEETVAELSKDEQHVVVDRPSTVTSFPLVRAMTKPDEK